MKNMMKKATLILMAFCILTAGIVHDPAAASAAGYQKSVSKKVKVKSGDDLSLNQYLLINIKENTEVTITVKATDKKSKDFSVNHSSYCSYCMSHENEFGDDSEMAFGESSGKKSVKLVSLENGSTRFNLRKGKHIIDFQNTSGRTQNLKITIKSGKPVLKIVKWKSQKL